MTVARFRKVPVEIEAVRYTYPASPALRAWMGSNLGAEYRDPSGSAPGEAQIVTLEDGRLLRAAHMATHGDWIVKGVAGEFYAIKPEIFAVTYEPVVDRPYVETSSDMPTSALDRLCGILTELHHPNYGCKHCRAGNYRICYTEGCGGRIGRKECTPYEVE